MTTTAAPRPVCELVGKQEIASKLAETLNMAGLRPYSVSVCGVYISARFRGPEPAHKAASIFAVSGFHCARVVESLDYAADQASRKTLHPKTIRAWVATARATPRAAT